MAEPICNVLTCDGGGIRGVITARLLQALDPSVLDSIDLFAGTSTGSIIALGLASGVPIDTIVELYSSQACCAQIFQPYLPAAERDRASEAVAATLEAPPDLHDRLRELGPVLLFPKYRSTGLRELLTRCLPDMTLAEAWAQRKKGVVVPSFQLGGVASSGERQWQARLFNNLPHVAWMPETKLVDAAMASAAAPVYFPPHDVPGVPGGNAFIDGGVFANNPSLAALATLTGSRLTEEPNVPLTGIRLLSVGTGFTASSYPPPDARFPYGVLGWLRPRQDDGAPSFPLVGVVFDGTSQINDFTAQLMLGADNYIRVNPPFEATFSMDDCSAVPAMLAATERFMASDEWQRQSARINRLFGNTEAGGMAQA